MLKAHSISFQSNTCHYRADLFYADHSTIGNRIVSVKNNTLFYLLSIVLFNEGRIISNPLAESHGSYAYTDSRLIIDCQDAKIT